MNTTRGMVKTMKKGSHDQESRLPADAAMDDPALAMREKHTSGG